MLKLIKLELKRNNLRTYILAGIISCVVLLGFIYLFAVAAQEEDTIGNLVFREYANLFRLNMIISLVIFSCMSAIMNSRLILDEYSGKRAVLLFSYPISRSKILSAKLILVFAFTSISMLISTSIVYIVFSITESVSPIVVQDVMTMEVLIEVLKLLVIAVLAHGGIGIVSLRLGFIKKSLPTTMISAIILSAIYGNVAVSANGILPTFFISGISLIIAVTIMVELSNKVNKMEAE